MRAAIYARKSTEDPTSASIKRQIARGRAYAERKGWTVDERHIYCDDGVSGAEFVARHGLTRLLAAVAQRPLPFDVVITADADRIGRHGPRSALVFLDLSEAGIRVFYALTDEEQRFDSALDRMTLSLRAFGSELEREKAKQRTRDALLRRAEQGHVTGGLVYGYRNVPVLSEAQVAGQRVREHVRREIDPEQATAVRAIFQAYADGWGLRAIARGLNGDPEQGEVSGRYFRGRRIMPPRGGLRGWDASTVRAVLHRETYRGEVVWGKRRNTERGGRTRCQVAQPEDSWVRRHAEELRIVPDALWNAVRQRQQRSGRHGSPVHGNGSASLFSGLGCCGVCGGPFTISGSRKRAQCYGCSWHRNRGSTVCANGLLESVSVVDARLLAEIERTVLTPEARRFVLDTAERALLRATACASRTEADLHRALSRVQQEAQRLVRAIELGEPPQAILEQLRTREQEQAAIEVELAATRRRGELTELDRRRLRRVLAEGLAHLGGIFAADRQMARQAFSQLFPEKIRFAPTTLPNGERTYRFEAKLALGRITSLVRQNGVSVPDGI